MATPVFADTSYFIAALNNKDMLHRQALALAERLTRAGRGFVTTDPVLFELGNYFSKMGPALRAGAIRLQRRVRSAKNWRVLPWSQALLLRAEARYLAHADKTWSLTDCHSMEAMLEGSITEAATSDHHFTQAGFEVLLPVR